MTHLPSDHPITSTGRRTAFTLAEMLVVLLILSALAFVAVEALRPVASQARFEATQRTLENVRRAIVGEAADSAPNAAVRGFVADMGRFPETLAELVQVPADQAPANAADSSFGLRPGPGVYHSIMTPAGWRGPYVLAPPGASSPLVALRDGWGTPLAPAPPLPLTPDAAGAIAISSPVTNERIDAAPEYAVELSAVIRPEDWRPTLIAGTLFRLDGTMRAPPSGVGVWRIAVLGPGRLSGPGADPNGVKVIEVLATAAPTGEVSYSILGESTPELTAGPRVIVATLDGVLQGRPLYVPLRGGGTHVIDLQVE
ncbi:MAG: type II secretion system protein [Pirellulales bacterium]